MGACHCKASVETTSRNVEKPILDTQLLAPIVLDDYGFVCKSNNKRLSDLSKETGDDVALAAKWQQFISSDEMIKQTRATRNSEWPITRIPCWVRQEVWRSSSGALCLKQGSTKAFNDYVESTDQLTRSQVEIDAPRTFSNHAYFVEGGQGRQRLKRLLYAISSRLGSEIGYVQGMNMVVAVILFVVDDDEDAFWILVAFMEDLGMRTMFADGLRALTENLNRLGQSISSTMPNLTAHFGQENIEPFCYGTPWFLTMFAYNLPVRQTVRLYDVAFLTGMGHELIHRFALVFIKSVESELLKRSFTESTTLLKNIVIDDSLLEGLIKKALSTDLDSSFRIKGADIEEGGEEIRIRPETIIKDKSHAINPGQEWDSIPGTVMAGTTEAMKSTGGNDNANDG